MFRECWRGKGKGERYGTPSHATRSATRVDGDDVQRPGHGHPDTPSKGRSRTPQRKPADSKGTKGQDPGSKRTRACPQRPTGSRCQIAKDLGPKSHNNHSL